jgi:hypothetical protein
MQSSHVDATGPNATLRIWGHARVAARLDVDRYPFWAWVGRITLFTGVWKVGTLLTLVITFDPFVAMFPFVLGIGLIYHGVKGRYRVRQFRGVCPRCRNELELKPGSKIALPHRLDCFRCHFEPELHLETILPAAVPGVRTT